MLNIVSIFMEVDMLKRFFKMLCDYYKTNLRYQTNSNIFEECPQFNENENLFIDDNYITPIINMIGNEEFMKIVNTVNKSFFDSVNKIRNDINDIDSCHNIAHELKGMFGNIGATKAMNLVKDIQHSDNIQISVIDQLENVVNETIKALKQKYEN